MSVTSGFFNSLSGDRKYDAIQISSMFDGLITDGIYNGYLESFMVTASSPASMVVTVGEGRCWFNHTWTLNDAPLPLTLDVGDVVLNRIDTVVIDVDSTDTVRACTIKVVKGNPSSQAVAPTLENTETHHQYPLCDISVVAGATTVTQSNITNRRGTSDCPFVATLMTTVTVDELLVQWESQWNDWMTDRANSMDSWTAEQQEAFTTWFQTVQDILDEDTAGNLLNRINHRTGINATATYSEGVVAITAPDDAGEILTFVAPSDFLSSDTYTLNGEALTITDLNGEALDDSWKKNSPVTITVSGGKAFFKAGGSGKNDTLPPLLGNMTVEVVEGDETDTYTIKMDKLILDKTTEMVGGAQLEWGEEMPAKPGKGTGGIKTWTREEIITTGKPYDGLYAEDMPVSDAANTRIFWMPENSGGSKALMPYIIALQDADGVHLVRQGLLDRIAWGSTTAFDGSNVQDYLENTFLNSILDSNVVAELVEFTTNVNGSPVVTKCRVPTVTEIDGSIGTDGTHFPVFDDTAARIAQDSTGANNGYWTMSYYSASNVYIVSNTGLTAAYAISQTACVRPVVVIPNDFKIQQRPDGSYTVWNEMGLLTLGDIEASTDASLTKINIGQTNGLKVTRYLSNRYADNSGALLEYQDPVGTSSFGSSTYSSSALRTNVISHCTTYLPDALKTLVQDTTFMASAGGSNTSVIDKFFVLSLNDYAGDPFTTSLNNRTYSGQGQQIEALKTAENRKRSIQITTRQIDTTGNYPGVIQTSGEPYYNFNGLSNAQNYCPAFMLPLTTPIRALADGTYDLVPEDPALSTQTVSTLAETGTPVQLKDIPVSDASIKTTIYLKENGEDKPFLYLDADYETSGREGYVRLRDDRDAA